MILSFCILGSSFTRLSLNHAEWREAVKRTLVDCAWPGLTPTRTLRAVTRPKRVINREQREVKVSLCSRREQKTVEKQALLSCENQQVQMSAEGKSKFPRARRVPRMIFGALAGSSDDVISFFIEGISFATPWGCQDDIFKSMRDLQQEQGMRRREQRDLHWSGIRIH